MPFILLEDLQEYISVQGTCALICRLWLSDEVGGVGRAKPSQALAQEVALRFVAAAHSSTVRASMGGPPSGEGPERCGTPVRVIVAMAGVSLRLSLAPWLLALQLLQFTVDRAQTPLTGDVLPPPHDARVPQATGRVLQGGEPPMDGVRHEGPPSSLSGPHGGIGNCTEKTPHWCRNKSTRVGLALSRTLYFRHLHTSRWPRGEGVEQRFSMKVTMPVCILLQEA
jgi:hypothetical protein